MNHSVKITKLAHLEGLPLPTYATDQSAGLDLMAAILEPIILKSGEFKIIPSGIAIALPRGYEAQVRPRSGLAAKYGVTILNSPGTVDSDYRGEIKAILINHGTEEFIIDRGMRIAQLVIAKHQQISWNEVESLTTEETSRGDKGFGSTGIYSKLD